MNWAVVVFFVFLAALIAARFKYVNGSLKDSTYRLIVCVFVVGVTGLVFYVNMDTENPYEAEASVIVGGDGKPKQVVSSEKVLKAEEL